LFRDLTKEKNEINTIHVLKMGEGYPGTQFSFITQVITK